MHLLYKRIRNLKFLIDLQIQLFEQTILPIASMYVKFGHLRIQESLRNYKMNFLRSFKTDYSHVYVAIECRKKSHRKKVTEKVTDLGRKKKSQEKKSQIMLFLNFGSE